MSKLFYILFFCSGAVSLAWESLLARYISNMAGDMYTIHLTVLLAFILFGALGNLFTIKYKKLVPVIEIITGTTLLLSAVFADSIWNNIAISSYGVLSAIIMTFLPAFVLGMHIPFYASYIKSKGFAFGYSLYALAGVISIISVELWFISEVRSLSNTMILFALLQVIIGFVLMGIVKAQKEKIVLNVKIIEFIKSYKVEIFKVFLFSCTSFILYYWAIRTAGILLLPLRMQSSLFLAASLFTVSFGSFIAVFVQKAKSSYLKNNINVFTMMIATTVLSVIGYSYLVPYLMITMPLYHPIAYLFYIFIVAVGMMLPCIWSSLFFTNLTAEAMVDMDKESMQKPSAIFSIIAALSNIIGIVIGACFVEKLWIGSWYFIIPLAIMPIFFVGATKNKKLYKKSITVLVIAIIGAGILLAKYNTFDRLIKTITNTSQHHESKYKLDKVKFHIDAFSSIMTIPSTIFDDIEVIMYYVDGFLSHPISNKGEYLQGQLPSYYFDKEGIENTLVIGVGSGQTSFSASLFSHHTDIVDISPSLYAALDLTKEYNADLQSNPYVDMHMQDGYNFIKTADKKYDVVISTSTYPSNYNSNKLYTLEFFDNLAKIIKPSSIYMNYMLGSFKQEDLETFLAPIRAHFKYVDVWQAPYPTIVAYNEPRDSLNYKQNKYFEERKQILKDWNLDGKFFEEDGNMGLRLIDSRLAFKYEPKGMNTMDFNTIEHMTIYHYLNRNFDANGQKIQNLMEKYEKYTQKALHHQNEFATHFAEIRNYNSQAYDNNNKVLQYNMQFNIYEADAMKIAKEIIEINKETIKYNEQSSYHREQAIYHKNKYQEYNKKANEFYEKVQEINQKLYPYIEEEALNQETTAPIIFED